jgi:signal transduction histidine kinase
MCEGADARLLSVEPPFEEIELDVMIKHNSWARLSVTRAEGATIFVRLTNITAYKEASLALQSALERERETTSAYRSFVSMVSHQFRTPLAILDSSAQRILRRGSNLSTEELATRVQKIRKATTRLTRLVESVLNASKLDAGRMEVNPSSCSLADLVMDICERQREASPNADIRFDVPSEEIQVHCDGMLIEQVVTNLLSNAVKYSGEKPIVEVKIWTDGGRAYCSVRDWGIGIPADELPKIFERFYRARTAVGIAGTGIGLNFAQKIMHLHGGAIQVESYEAAGSLFTFDLPISNVDEAQQAA